MIALEQKMNVLDVESKITYFSKILHKHGEDNEGIAKEAVSIIKTLNEEHKDEKRRIIRIENYASNFTGNGIGFEEPRGITGASIDNDAGTKPKNVGPAQEEDDFGSCEDK